MCAEYNHQCDTEFAKLLARGTDIDLTLLSLEIARDAYPDLNFADSLNWIDDRVRELISPVSAAKTDREVLIRLRDCLAGEHGLGGHPGCFANAESSYLHKVIETRQGIPITLSILYMAVAERLGLELYGVASPMHFLTCCETPAGPLYLDAFTQGRILTQTQCVEWIASISGLKPKQIQHTLTPASPRTIIIRVLNNLKYLYTQQENWSAAWLVQHRLTALQPTSYQERRDLALISLRAGRPGPALDLLLSCLTSCPKEESDHLEGMLQETEKQIARWN